MVNSFKSARPSSSRACPVTTRIGIKKLADNKPDLITLDLQMPEDTGTGFYRKMHHDSKYKDIPVIVISGIAGRHLAVKNPVAVFDKPIDKDELLKAVKEAIG